jgi:hypothetical protein
MCDAEQVWPACDAYCEAVVARTRRRGCVAARRRSSSGNARLQSASVPLSALSDAGAGTCDGVNAGGTAARGVTTRMLEASENAQRGAAAGSYARRMMININADAAMASCACRSGAAGYVKWAQLSAGAWVVVRRCDCAETNAVGGERELAARVTWLPCSERNDREALCADH